MIAKKMRRALLAGAAAAALFASAAEAQAPARNFNVPPGDMAAALQAYSRQAGVQIVWSNTDVRGLRSAGVTGTLTPAAALGQLVAGTGLQVVADSSGALSLKKETPDSFRKGEKDEEENNEAIIVTGTRLDERFAGTAPVQVVDAEKARAAGVISSSAVLNNSPQVSGPRSQLRFNRQLYGGGGAFYDGGPGSQTIALRGFTAAQTLLLLNGRRLPPAGVEGVPRSADVGLIPSAIVSRYEILTDGASPVYGSDAIAGIVNIVLKQDYEGLAASYVLAQPEVEGGREQLFSVDYGKTFDKGHLGLAAEYRVAQRMTLADRSFFGLDCEAEYDMDGEGRVVDLLVYDTLIPGTSLSPCNSNNLNSATGRFVDLSNFQTFWRTPGRSNVGVSEYSLLSAPGFLAATRPGSNFVLYDSDNNGVIEQPFFDPELGWVAPDETYPDPDRDGSVGFDQKDTSYDLTRTKEGRATDLISPIKQINLFAYGSYDVGDDTNVFFEAGYNRREADVRFFGNNFGRFYYPLFIPRDSPFNPCGIEGEDCGAIFQPEGAPPRTPEEYATAIIVEQKIVGDSDRVTSKIELGRVVAGIKGRLPWLNGIGPASFDTANWGYELSLVYGKTNGVSRRRGIRTDRLELARNAIRDPATGEIRCAQAAPAGEPTCVPVNFFSDRLFRERRLSQQEENYLFDDLIYDTDTEQLVVTGFLRGELGSLPGGPISVILGGEYREESIDAGPNQPVSLFETSVLSVEAGAKGTRKNQDAFAEIGLPIIAQKPLAHDLRLSLAGRITDDKFSGTNSTYSVKGRYAPWDWLAFRGTYGTSIRSPNLHELFLIPTFGQGFVFDPCVVPVEARVLVQGPNGELQQAYDQANDFRRDFPYVLDACRAQNVDPTALGLNSSQPLAAIRSGGATEDLKAEESTSLTAGIVLDVPFRRLSSAGWTNDLGLRIAVTYYDLKVRNRISYGSEPTIIGECFFDDPEVGGGYCNRIVRDASGFINQLNLDFINRDAQQTRGIDFNFFLRKGFRIGARPFDFSLDVAGNYEFDNIFSNFGFSDDLSGESFVYPQLKLSSTLQLRSGPWIGTFYTRYVDAVTIPEDRRRPPGAGVRTCLGINDCQAIYRLDDYIVNNASVSYNGGNWQAVIGVNNLFDVDPPRISGNYAPGGYTGTTNTILTGNYDAVGRSLVLQIRKEF